MAERAQYAIKVKLSIREDGQVSFINYAAREINCKLVYYGPGLGGKTANLQWIYEHAPSNQKGKMISLATETDRTLFFDFLPLDLGTVRGFRTRFHLYTVPGQVFYDASRKLLLKGVDGVVFVADSQEERLDANHETIENLRENLKEHGYNFDHIPYVLQFNKRDLPNVLPCDVLTRELQQKGEPTLEAIAILGSGVFETLKVLARQVLTELRRGG
ncbi:MAG TPA: GTPase domain-containing protein, partial [Candidatus Acidoferrales bacterium]